NAHGLGVRGPCLSGTGFRPKLLPLLCLEHAAWRRASGSPIRAKSTLSGITSARATSKRDKASMAATAASYDRRAEEWKLQLALAEAELRQIDQQLVAADIRVEVARAE